YYYCCPAHYYFENRCPAGMVPAEDLELAVLEAIENTYFDDEQLGVRYAAWQVEVGQDVAVAAEIEELRAKLPEIERRIANLLDQAETGSSVAGRLAEREAERDAAAQRLIELESRPSEILLPPTEAQGAV